MIPEDRSDGNTEIIATHINCSIIGNISLNAAESVCLLSVDFA